MYTVQRLVNLTHTHTPLMRTLKSCTCTLKFRIQRLPSLLQKCAHTIKRCVTAAIDPQDHAQSAQGSDSLCIAFGVTSLEDDQILLWVVKKTTMVGPWPQIDHEIMTFRALKTLQLQQSPA